MSDQSGYTSWAEEERSMEGKKLTEHQAKVFDELLVLAREGVSPTVRSLADRLESRRYRSERWTDDEVRGVLERLEAAGYVEQVDDVPPMEPGEVVKHPGVRYRPTTQAQEE